MYRPVLAGVALAFASQLAAQTPTPQSDNEIVVTAQRSGAPTWTIDTDNGTIVLVGELRNVPKSTPWEPNMLEEATREASQVIVRIRPSFSVGDVFRVMFKRGRFTKLPDKSVAGDYLNPEQRARLGALEEQYRKDYDRRSFLMTGFDLLTKRLDFDDDTTKDATEIVKKAAKRAKVPITHPERFRGKDLLNDLSDADPASHIPCLEAAMTATEAGKDIIAKRGDDWRKFDIPAVMDNPLEIALGRCWPWADPEIGEEIRTQWVTMIEGAVDTEGVTLAVVPLRVLAEDEGVLDQLEARGFEIYGPLWRRLDTDQ